MDPATYQAKFQVAVQLIVASLAVDHPLVHQSHPSWAHLVAFTQAVIQVTVQLIVESLVEVLVEVLVDIRLNYYCYFLSSYL